MQFTELCDQVTRVLRLTLLFKIASVSSISNRRLSKEAFRVRRPILQARSMELDSEDRKRKNRQGKETRKTNRIPAAITN